MTEQFKPKIIAFVCNWCSYGGADNAGNNKFPVPAEIRLIRVMCSGRIDSQFVIEALQDGADGVMILGCHPGDCHYKEGNYSALKRNKLLEKILDGFGISRERVYLDWVAASEGEKFSRVTTEFVNKIKSIGPYIQAVKTTA
ncbi:hydrogenase iron-sulfur subunit [Candidatus Dependentiae bacterium]|nr:hydrogenase iron-sulfur subunit [Candidatus Dependentiae bacterium]